MRDSMWALTYDRTTDPWDKSTGMRRTEVERPTLDEAKNYTDSGMVMIRTRYAGFCGSDRGIWFRRAFVRAPEGNGCAERFIRTLKENLLWVRHFETIEELCQALLAFRETYNTTWLIERHGFVSPAEFRQDQLQSLVEAA